MFSPSSNFPSTLFLSKFKCDVPSCSPGYFLTHSKSVSTRDPARLFFCVFMILYSFDTGHTLMSEVPLNIGIHHILKMGLILFLCLTAFMREIQQKPTLNVITQLCSGTPPIYDIVLLHTVVCEVLLCVCVLLGVRERVVFSRCKSLSFFFFCL